MAPTHQSGEFQEGDLVVARRQFSLTVEGAPVHSRQRTIAAGTLLRLVAAASTDTGRIYHAGVLEEPAAVGLVSTDSIDPAPGFGPSEQALLKFLPEFAAGPTARMGPQGVRQLAQLGIYRARSYGLSASPSLQLYAGLMMQLGVDFDDDPFYPWARAALKGTPAAAYPMAEHQRVRALYASSADYSQRVLGKDSEHLRNALLRATQLRLGSLPSAGAGFIERMRGLLRDLYPQRMESAATDALEQTAAFFQGRANKQATGKGLAVQVAVNFAMGRGAFQDPRFPPLREVRENPERLFEGLQKHFQQELRDRGWK